MNVLPVGQSLRQLLPEVDEFLLDPAGYLGAAPLEIGPRRAFGLAALFAVAGAAFLVAAGVSGNWHDERLLLGAGLLIGASVWLGWSLRLRGHSLLLRPDGVEVRYRDTSVWCPWALFNVDGAPIVPEGNDPRVAVILPVSPEAIPFVELRRNESPVAHGRQVRAPQFRFTGGDQVVLGAQYSLAASDLGLLLLQLGSRLGRRLPRGLPPPEAYPASEVAAAEIAGPDAGGWYSVPLGKLRFPPRCCGCGQATAVTVRWPLSNFDIAGRFTGTARGSEVAVPFCPDCQTQVRQAYHRGGIRGLNGGAVVGALVSVALALVQGERSIASLAFVALAGVAIGSLVGFLLGSAWTRPLPIRFRHFRPDRGTLQMRFRDPHYADLFLAGTRNKESPG
jgi:hypothetical protein